MVTSIIKKSELEGAERIDAEYYQPSYIKVRSLLASIPTVTLEEISRKFKKGIFDIKADTYVLEGTPFIRISNLKNGLIDDTNIAYLSPEAHERERSTSLECDDIVLSKTAYPAASLVTFKAANISQDIIGISLKPEWREKLLPSFVVTFLNSRYGMSEMQQWFQGNIQMHLALPDAKRILIPIIKIDKQQQIADLLDRSQDKLLASQSFMVKAEALLLEELGFKEADFEDELSYVVDVSEAAERTDAEYFQPKYLKLVEKLNQYGAKPLTELAQDVRSDFDPSLKPDESFNYVELSNIDFSIGVIDGSSEVLGKEAPGRAKRMLKPGDVVVSSVEGSLEKVALVDEPQNGYLASTGFFQLRSDKILPEVLLVLAKSPILQMQFKRQCTGTILTAVPKDSLHNIVLPILPEKLQITIKDLVQKSHAARQKSKQLLESAKHQVEELIEKGG